MIKSVMDRDVTHTIPTVVLKVRAFSGKLLTSEIREMVDLEMNRDDTYAIPTEEMDCEVIHAIPTTELDQDVIHLVEMMNRGQVVRPLIVTTGEVRDNLRKWFIVEERFQVRRMTTSDYTLETKERLMEQPSRANQCHRRAFVIDHIELFVHLHDSNTD